MTARGNSCVVRVGIDEYLLSTRDGLKLVEIMARARLVERDYLPSGQLWKDTGKEPPIQITLARAGQIAPADKPRKPITDRSRLIEGPKS